MQDKKLINVSQAVIGGQGVYSIEFHEDQHYTHVKRVNSDGTASYFSVGGSGGTTYTAGSGIDITNGVISSTVTDTNTFIYGVVLNGTDLEFTGAGGAFNGTIDLSSIANGGSVTETNLVAQKSAGIDTNNVSAYGFSDTAVNLTLSRTDGTDVDFVLRAGFSLLGSNNFGIIQAKVVLNATGFGNIKLQYEDMTGAIIDITPVALSSGVAHLVFAYWGDQRMQLLSYQLA